MLKVIREKTFQDLNHAHSHKVFPQRHAPSICDKIDRKAHQPRLMLYLGGAHLLLAISAFDLLRALEHSTHGVCEDIHALVDLRFRDDERWYKAQGIGSAGDDE